HVSYLTPEVIAKERLKPLSLISADIESSFKSTNISLRESSNYNRVGLAHRLGFKIRMQHSVAFYNQTILGMQPGRRPGTPTTVRIDINQKEYYNRTSLNLSDRVQLIGAYHYLYTPFNNYIYNNHVGLLGIKYFSNYFDLQGDGVFSKLTDSSHTQFNLTAGVYPKGNLNVYGVSTISYRTGTNSGVNLKQVVGLKVFKNTWLELNGTFGEFRNFVENDALYVYNAIDKNVSKGGATVYFTISPRFVANAGYTFEQRELFQKTNLFNQQSITGGLTCKF
ncbi:MAG TPA: hypothetical protein VF610_04520, partial [Segetibacter sp.]